MRRRLPLVVAGGVLVGLVLVGAWAALGDQGVGLGKLAELRDQALAWLQSIPPWLYLAAFAVLPAFGFPLSLFFLTAPQVLGGPGGLWGILGGLVALFINLALGYLLPRGLLRAWAERRLTGRMERLKAPPEGEQWRVLLLVRITPLPFLMKNAGLALAGFSFWRYMAISWAVEGLIGVGVMLVGPGLFAGDFQKVLLGVGLLLGIWAILPVLRRRLEKRKAVVP